MTTTVHDNPDEQRFEALVDGEVVGFAAYDLQGDRVAFTHTEVSEEHSGEGVARQLVTTALDDVAQRGLGVVPLCSYVRKVVADDRDRYLPLVPEDVRVQVGLD